MPHDRELHRSAHRVGVRAVQDGKILRFAAPNHEARMERNTADASRPASTNSPGGISTTPPLSTNFDAEYLARAFTYHAPKDDQPERYNSLREIGRVLATEIIRQSKPSRERSLALTKLEEALMWANAGIARNG